MRYTVTLDSAGTLFDSENGDVESETAKTLDAPAQGGTLTFKLSCTDTTARCAGFVDVRGIGLLVSDTTRPRDGGVSRNSPVDKALTVTPGATDDGVGLDRAEVTITNAQGTVVGTGATTFTNCVDLSPFAGIDRRLDPSHCRAGTIPVSVNTEDKLRYPEGIYYRTVTVYDAAGNATTVLDREPFEIWHPNLGSAVAQLSIGSGGPTADPTRLDRQRPRGRRAGVGVPFAAVVGGAGLEAAAHHPRRAGVAGGQEVPLRRPADLRRRPQAPLGAEADADRDPQQGRQADRQEAGRADRRERPPEASSSRSRARRALVR